MHRGFGFWAMIQRVLVTGFSVAWAAFFLVWTLYFVATPVLGAENPLKFQHYSLNDGLSQGSIISIVQDRQGFLWLKTPTVLSMTGFARC
jgi:hypothetical protein